MCTGSSGEILRLMWGQAVGAKWLMSGRLSSFPFFLLFSYASSGIIDNYWTANLWVECDPHASLPWHYWAWVVYRVKIFFNSGALHAETCLQEDWPVSLFSFSDTEDFYVELCGLTWFQLLLPISLRTRERREMVSHHETLLKGK